MVWSFRTFFLCLQRQKDLPSDPFQEKLANMKTELSHNVASAWRGRWAAAGGPSFGFLQMLPRGTSEDAEKQPLLKLMELCRGTG